MESTAEGHREVRSEERSSQALGESEAKRRRHSANHTRQAPINEAGLGLGRVTRLESHEVCVRARHRGMPRVHGSYAARRANGDKNRTLGGDQWISTTMLGWSRCIGWRECSQLALCHTSDPLVSLLTFQSTQSAAHRR